MRPKGSVFLWLNGLTILAPIHIPLAIFKEKSVGKLITVAVSYGRIVGAA